MVKKVILSLFFLVLILPMVMGVPPQTQTSNIAEGLEIAYPKYDYIKQNSSFTLNTHVINTTSPVTDATCLTHLYGPMGIHTAKLDMVLDGIEYEADINGGNFTDLGIHSYIIQCNTTSEAGFVSGALEITASGKEPAGDVFKLGFSVLIIVLSGSLIIILIRSIGHIIDLDYDLMDLGSTWGLYLALFAATMIANEYMSNSIINETLVFYIEILSFPMIIVPMVALVFSIFVQGKRRNKEESYNFFRLQPPR